MHAASVQRPVPAADASTLGQRQIYILPTARGLAFGLLQVVMLLGAINYNSSLAYLLVFLLFAASLVLLIHTWRNLIGLRVHFGRPQPVFAGQPAAFDVHLDNLSRYPRPSLLVVHRDGGRRVFIAPGSSATVRLLLPTDHRGWRELNRVALASSYPSGLFRAWAPVASPARCLVYPRPVGHQDLPAGGGETREGTGSAGIGTDDFSGLREYRHGDPPRHIHWKRAASTGEPLLKHFTGTRGGERVFRYAEARGPGAEARLGQLCRWVLQADRLGLRYALELPGVSLGAADGARHRARCLEALALFRGA